MSAMPPKAGIELSYDATGTNTMADTVAIDRRTADKPVSRPAPSARQPVVRKGNEVNLPGALTIYVFGIDLYQSRLARQCSSKIDGSVDLHQPLAEGAPHSAALGTSSTGRDAQCFEVFWRLWPRWFWSP
jgi:hypothetical protein